MQNLFEGETQVRACADTCLEIRDAAELLRHEPGPCPRVWSFPPYPPVGHVWSLEALPEWDVVVWVGILLKLLLVRFLFMNRFWLEFLLRLRVPWFDLVRVKYRVGLVAATQDVHQVGVPVFLA